MDCKTVKKVLEVGLGTGADYAELYFQDATKHVISLDHKRVDTVKTTQVYGVGIRLMQDANQVYGYTSDTSESALIALAKKLAVYYNGERKYSVGDIKMNKPKSVHAPQKPTAAMTTEQKIDWLKIGEKAMYAASPLIVNAECGLMEIAEKVEVYTVDKGVAQGFADERVRTRVVVQAVASRDGEFEIGLFAPGESSGLEFLDTIDIKNGAEKTAKLAVDLLDAPECPSGNMPVVLGNAFGGVLFHEACGHPLEGTAISHNTSPFAGKLGQKIASDVVTAIDDGTIAHGWGSEEFDDEGIPSTRNVLIKNGELVSYMVDRFDGRRMGMTPTGSCRRESYKFLPTTRMTNTYIDAGKSTPEEIIAATENGIYCVSFNGGSVDSTTCKFNFTSSETYVIKSGKIAGLVKPASLVGYGYEILKKIDMVANDLELRAGTCGAASGMCPVSVGQPTLRVSEMTVGGKGE